MTFALIAAISYLLGSIPFGYLLIRLFRGGDIRQTGSGNIGATNVARSSPLLGIVTLVLDAAKGYAAVYLAFLISRQHRPFLAGREIYLLASVAALFAVLGHVFPVWLKFRGGKGVATGFGSFLWLAPKAILVMGGIFFVVVFVFRYVSLGSIVAVALFPFLAWLLDGYLHTRPVLLVMAAASALIIAKHHKNIRRLRAGTESRFQWRRG